VLLKSDPGRVLGFTTKLTDFGLSKVVSNTPEAQIVNIIGAGALKSNTKGGLRAICRVASLGLQP
jgi:hypothetical protein